MITYLFKESIKKALKAEEVLARLAVIARGDIGDFLELDENGDIEINLIRAREQGLTQLIKRIKCKRIPEKDKETGEVLYTQEVQLELYSSHDALRDIARVHGLFKNNIHTSIDAQLGVLRTDTEIELETWAEQIVSYRKKLQSKLSKDY